MSNITNEKLLKVLSNNDRMLYGSRKGKILEDAKKIGNKAYHGCCTSGPQGWYAQAGISLGWWNSFPVTYDNSCNRLKSCGMIPVWHGSLSDIDSLTESNLRPGDIGTLYTGGGKHQHGMMWTGHDWRSDCIQRKASCYSSSNQGTWAAVIWRHPDLQQNEWGDINNMNSGVGSVDFTGNGSDGYSNAGGSSGVMYSLGGSSGASNYTNGNGVFSGTSWGEPISGNVDNLYSVNGNRNGVTSGVLLGTHMRQKNK